MSSKYKPEALTSAITLVPCKLSKDGKSFIPAFTPLSRSELLTSLKKSWSAEEDALLLELGMKCKKWNLISLEINKAFHNGVLIRDQKHCRERWKNFIDPDLKKKPFSRKEDEMIVKYYEKYKSWAKVAKKIKHRNENQVKNRYRALMSKGFKVEQEAADELPNAISNFSGFGFESIANYLTPIGSAIIPSFNIDHVQDSNSFNFQTGMYGSSFSTQMMSTNVTNSFFNDSSKGMFFSDFQGNSNFSKFESILDNFCDKV
jgi:hypothetical protein